MALIECEDCGKNISENAAACPDCGAPTPQQRDPSKKYEPYTDQEVSVMLSKKRSTSHLLHFVLSLVTFGVWAIIWVFVAANNGTENQRIEKRIAKGKKIK